MMESDKLRCQEQLHLDDLLEVLLQWGKVKEKQLLDIVHKELPNYFSESKTNDGSKVIIILPG